MRIGKYEIISEIKKTGYTHVFKAYHRELKRHSLLKSILKNYPEDLIKRFKEEAKVLAEVEHPDVVKIYEIFEKDNKIFISLEWIDGYDLSRLIEICGKIPPDIATYIIYKVLGILEYVHNKGIIHRDIKPSNILISKDGFIKLTDFGIAKKEDSPDLTQPGVVIGTPYYMSPEQIKGKELSPSSDIFSLGCAFYEMLTGKKAFQGNDTTEILLKIEKENPDYSRKTLKGINKKLKKILKKSLSKNIKKRYKNAREFKNDILKYLGEKKILKLEEDFKNFINKKISILETQTLVGDFKKEGKKFRLIKKVIFITPFILLLLIWLSFKAYVNFFFPSLDIRIPFKVTSLKINEKFYPVPFKGRIKPGVNKIEIIAPFYVYKGILNLKPRQNKKIIIPYNEKDSLIFHFRGKGAVYVNHKKIGEDSVDYRLKPAVSYLFEVIKDKDTVFKYFLPDVKKDVIWFQMLW